jgi:uncharacterized phage protein (TIGR01671 family)
MLMQDRFRFRTWYKDHYIYDIQLVGADWSVTKKCNEDCFGDFFYNEYCVIEQCTGLKDKNGQLIYEGDILDFDLSTPRNGGHYRGFIRWQKRNDLIGWMISDMDMAGDWDLRQIAHPNDWMVWGEIIGNIHKNRELLEFNPEDYDIRV